MDAFNDELSSFKDRVRGRAQARLDEAIKELEEVCTVTQPHTATHTATHSHTQPHTATHSHTQPHTHSHTHTHTQPHTATHSHTQPHTATHTATHSHTQSHTATHSHTQPHTATHSHAHQKNHLHLKMLLVAARHHNIIVFMNRQQWKNVNDTIADCNLEFYRTVPCYDAT